MLRQRWRARWRNRVMIGTPYVGQTERRVSKRITVTKSPPRWGRVSDGAAAFGCYSRRPQFDGLVLLKRVLYRMLQKRTWIASRFGMMKAAAMQKSFAAWDAVWNSLFSSIASP